MEPETTQSRRYPPPISEIEKIPGPRPEPSQRIDPQALIVWRITAAITSLFVWAGFGIGVMIAIAAGLNWNLAVLALILPVIHSVLTIAVIPPIRWRRWRYEVTDREIDLQRGVFIVTRTLIPMSRVQHVDTEQGPLFRHFDLAGVNIATAGGVHEIPALSTEAADDVRDRISHLAEVADDV